MNLLPVCHGRTLAYTQSGNLSSPIVVVQFHSIFSVGGTKQLNPSMRHIHEERGVHLLAPTLPGWGDTSPPLRGTSFAACIIADVTALLEHLHKDVADLKLYLVGSKHGSIPAQILYGAPFDVFPFGRNIAAVLVTHPISPHESHKQYTDSFNWITFMMFGAPSHILPSNLVLRYYMRSLRRKLSTVDGALPLVLHMFGRMSAKEREILLGRMKKQGLTEDQVARQRAEAAVLSVKTSWAGYLAIPSVIRGDWGFKPAALDKEHAGRPIMVICPKGSIMGQRLIESYENVQAIYCKGKDFAVVRGTSDIWNQFLSIGTKNQSA
ncbi:hypothetical protein B0H21DRAFT_555697 [Amylocystis lapponica]|nr:hypothetical protein B0H21DRAFT_555697 [Amylocystis lapponica]